MNQSLRQAAYLLFIICIMSVGPFLLSLSFFECLLLIAVTGLIIKLTDIEEAIIKK